MCMTRVNSKTPGTLQEKHRETYEDGERVNLGENDGLNNDIIRKQRTPETASSSFKVNVSRTSKEENVMADFQVFNDTESGVGCTFPNEMQRNQVREVKEVSRSKTESNKCNFEADQATTQTECRGYRSNYLYDRNPLQDPSIYTSG